MTIAVRSRGHPRSGLEDGAEASEGGGLALRHGFLHNTDVRPDIRRTSYSPSLILVHHHLAAYQLAHLNHYRRQQNQRDEVW